MVAELFIKLRDDADNHSILGGTVAQENKNIFVARVNPLYF